MKIYEVIEYTTLIDLALKLTKIANLTTTQSQIEIELNCLQEKKIVVSYFKEKDSN